MSEQQNQGHAIIVLPATGRPGSLSTADRRWLSRGQVDSVPPANLLQSLLPELGLDMPDTGLAALRLWGQTDVRPDGWVAAADPVILEAMLSHVILHAPSDLEVTEAEFAAVCDLLQRQIAGHHAIEIVRNGRYGYIRSERPMLAASQSPGEVDGQPLAPPGSSDAEDAAYHRLMTEMQMFLHDHEINRRREQAGKRPLNSLWIWGGGVAPEPQYVSLPPLYADDPVAAGFWRSRNAEVRPWTGDFEHMLATSGPVFAAIAAGDDDDAALPAALTQLRQLFESGKLNRMTLLFRDGLRVEVRRRYRFRFWRGISRHFTEFDHR